MKTKTPRVCLMLEKMDNGETFLDAVWKSTIHEAVESGINLVVFVGQFVGTPSIEEVAQSSVFKLVNSSVFDGFVICGSAFNQMDKNLLSVIRTELPSITGVVTSHPIPGLSSVIVDNESGLRDMMRHLIDDHGYRRIAFIKGPANNDEAESRFRVWHEEVERAGLPESLQLVVQGHFNARKAPQAYSDLCALPGKMPRAVVACTDSMALDIYERLIADGYRVPEDVAVTGFDNIGRGLYVSCPLSTVHQPIGETAARAVQQLLHEIKFGDGAVDIALPSTAVYRRSCGCHPNSLGGTKSEDPLPSLDADSTTIESILQSQSVGLDDIVSIRRSISGMHQKYWNVLELLELFNSFVRATAVIKSVQELSPILHHWLPRFGITKFCLGVCASESGGFTSFSVQPIENKLLVNPPDKFLLIAANPVPEGAVEGKTVYSAEKLAPGGWFEKIDGTPFVCFPLTVGENWYGLVLLEIYGDDSILFTGIQNHLATILDREYNLEKTLKMAIEEQTRTYSEHEKLNALSSLVRGMAHEMNTPLGSGITSSSYLSEQSKLCVEELVSGKISRQTLEELLFGVSDASGIIRNSFNRITQLVNTFKEIAVTESVKSPQSFDLASLIRRHVGMKFRYLENNRISTHYDMPETVEVYSYSDTFCKIIDQLLNNVVQGNLESQKDCVVSISLQPDITNPEFLLLTVADDGVGIADKELPHIFEPFFTTWRTRGHCGLGLHIVWNLVKHLLLGDIHCRSEIDEGTSVVIKFPVSVV
ncbi:MAG: substrate-binding domain-containing protein [Spirochaetes bacterium]|jgi:DNA-binding LacI/PurR family transcriptional regulator/signal transduction histidine kinase|nr:substrate-binding domain-containing protein [Spirochaetota bacterium]